MNEVIMSLQCSEKDGATRPVPQRPGLVVPISHPRRRVLEAALSWRDPNEDLHSMVSFGKKQQNGKHQQNQRLAGTTRIM